LKSIRESAKEFQNLETKLDVLICNAGVLAPASRTSDGFEMNLGVNHLGHFLFTNLLLEMLKASTPSRIVIVSSQAYMAGSINRDNLNSEKSFSNVWISYGNSKLANLLFMHELNKKLVGSNVTVNALCPGTVQTEASRYLNPVMKFFMNPLMKLFYSTPEIGCQTTLFLAVEPSLEKEGGDFYIGCKKKELMAKAKDDETAKWLWETSVELTNLN
jgi:NAD(P)-dependent dehydrogenase (short-subunit alcohol dehydrogenase family)